VVKQAVTRNRIKRLVREVMRLEVKTDPDKNYFFRIRRLPKTLNFETIRQAVSDAGL
jgi:ribonuclease P protein component